MTLLESTINLIKYFMIEDEIQFHKIRMMVINWRIFSNTFSPFSISVTFVFGTNLLVKLKKKFKNDCSYR